MGFLGSVVRNWQAVYRFNGGLSSLARCLLGSVRLAMVSEGESFDESLPEVDCVTFSVVPPMTTLWSISVDHAITSPKRLLVGDCSGGLSLGVSRTLHSPWKVYPLFNFPHGEKLDLFMHKICKAKYVIINDDDIFWLNEIPWLWALDQLEKDPNMAVVSLCPRAKWLRVSEDREIQFIGSYCLVIRRQIWMNERLSFKTISSPEYHDTADLAHLELLRRGYGVVVAPEKIQENLPRIEGISAWVLRIQRKSGDIRSDISEKPALQVKVLRAIYFVRGLERLLNEYFLPAEKQHLTPSRSLSRAAAICEAMLGKSKANDVMYEISSEIARIKGRLQAIIGKNNLQQVYSCKNH
jgi:hypothetical protein